MKKCKKCQVEKPLSEFFNNPRMCDGKFSACKFCDKTRYNNWRKENPEKRAKIKKIAWLRRYNLTVEQFEKMNDVQNNKCYICLEPARAIRKNGIKRLEVDHCHKTGKVRKLLCNHCNLALGLLREDPELFLKCINYLKEHS